MEDGDENFWQSRLEEAEFDYQRAIDTARLPDQRVQAQLGLCRLYRYQEAYARALEACLAAAEISPGSAAVHAETGRVYTWMGNFEEAFTSGESALALDGNNAAATAYYAEALAREADMTGSAYYGRALKFAEYARELDYEDPEIYRILGFIHHLDGDLDEASLNFQKALLLQPDFFAYYIDLGRAESGRGNSEIAFDAFNRALTLAPKSALALRGRGWAWCAEGDYQKARQDFQQAIVLNAQDSESWTGLGWTYYNEGGNQKALHAFDQALDLNPTNTQARVGLESLQIEMEAQAEAETAAAEAQARDAAEAAEKAIEAAEAAARAEDLAREAFQRAVQAAVQVYAFDQQLEIRSTCSGMVISPRGYLLTSIHCISDPASNQPYIEDWLVGIGIVTNTRRPPERLYRARAVVLDYDLDLALLQITADWNGNPLDGELNLVALEIGDSDALEVGDEVWTAGFPGMGSATLTLTKGIVSGFAEQDGLSWIKTDLMTGPGNSGGMVINAAGELVGVHAQAWFDQTQQSSRLSAELPVNAIRHLWEGVID